MRRIFPYISASIAAVTVATAFAASTAEAHAIWFAQRAKQLALVYGVGADDLDAVKRVPLITSVTGLDADSLPVTATLRVAGAIPVVDSDEPLAVVAATMDYGIWSKDAAGTWHNKGADEIKDATVSEHNFKYAVHINQMPSKPIPLIPSHKLQLLPVGDALPVAMGAPIKIRAFYEGKPMAGVDILQDYVNDPDQKPLKTDTDGYVTLPVRNQGLNVLVGIYVGKSDNPAKYKQMEYRSSLTFVLPHLPE
ncbi:nickel ABC transporter substrate-binding protein [Novosphingobium sp. AAP83]|uniref:DUF4198 domain-containing protein n=1 Tax=Novosphingobium sp. AAP83 TaxID=1523425 RepID=UPI0006B9629F|nr:DUF4198 domain-containing protein [Novosphingobium sp. AAP83]KPF90670.1 nickel ABC transporter substrate-binding protein [Novosphingobium sp. AAP83]